MAQTRYERLYTNNNSNDDDHGRLNNLTVAGRYDDDDDDNEEINLDSDHRVKYKESDDNVDVGKSFNNGHITDDRQSSTPNEAHNSGVTKSSMNLHTVPGSSFMHMAVGTLATILLYLTLSICLTFYQKALIKKLKFPFTIVSYHLVIKFILSAIVRSIYKCRTGRTRVQLDWRTAIRKMAPTGVASGIDIGFSNWGLELVPISLYTMTKSSTIVFILFFAILLGLEKKSLSLVFIVGLIAIGLFMFTYKSTQFNSLGFIFILVASLSSGVRWSLAQFVMQKTKLGLHNPVDMIFHMQPWMIASLLPFLITIEGQTLFDVMRDLSGTTNETIYTNIFKISFGAVLAFLMEVSEFMVLSQTSSLTLSIAGIFKDICQLALAVELNGDQLSLINVFGLVVCLAGICCHLLHKYSTLAKLEELHSLDELKFAETGINSNDGASSSLHNHTTISIKNKHSAQTVPLLEQTDSEYSNDDCEEQNASEVIFDILKRRDTQR